MIRFKKEALCSYMGPLALAAMAVLFLGPSQAHAKGKISSYLFGDYYWFANHNDKAVEGNNGFWVRRMYLTYDHEIDDVFSARIRFEANGDGDFAGGKMEPVLKDAYLKAKKFGQSAYFGLSPTPSWSVVEKHWGLRYVEKTPMDLFGMGSSRDQGASVKGAFGEGKTFGYHIMHGNGDSNSTEDDRSKTSYLSVFAKPAKILLLEIYGDYSPHKKGIQESSQYTLQGFIGLKAKAGRIGIQYANQTRDQGKNTTSLRQEVLSGYVVARITDKIDAFGRVDHMFDPVLKSGIDYLQINTTARPTFVLVGVDWEAGKQVHFIPNVESVSYSKVSSGGVPRPDDDLIARLTVYYKFGNTID